MDRLRSMEVFARVAEEQSFAEAGRQLRLPRGVVSKHVQRLEESFGTRLLNRTTRRVSLTEAGMRLYERCRAIIASVQEAEQELDEQRGKPRGRLRITAPVTFTELYFGAMLGRFLRRHPDVTAELECSDQFVDLVRDGFDVAIRIGELPPSSMVARRLASSSIVLCASPEYLRAHGEPASLDDLRHHVCLGYTYQSAGQSWDFSGSNGRVTMRIASRHRTNNNHMLRQLVLQGHGLAQLPTYFVAADIDAGRIVTVLDRYRDTSRSLYAVYLHRRHVPPKVRAFVDFVVQAFADGAPWENKRPRPRAARARPA
jgi:DNA-binding transcriptional LysR family regulator